MTGLFDGASLKSALDAFGAIFEMNSLEVALAVVILVVGGAFLWHALRRAVGCIRKPVRKPPEPFRPAAAPPSSVRSAQERERKAQRLQAGFSFLAELDEQDALMERAGVFYGRKDAILTWREREFAFVLRKVCDDRRLQLCPKVQIREMCFLKHPKDASKEARLAWDLVKMKHVDFLLCDAKWRPVAGVEYDDSSHETDRDTQRSDRYKEGFFKAMGVPLLRVKYGTYSREALGRLVDAVLAGPPSAEAPGGGSPPAPA